MGDYDSLSTTSILAAASEIFHAGGYLSVDQRRVEKWPITNARIFEDPCSIVAVVVYETWRHLSSGWTQAQGMLVELISEHVSSAEAKAWDGYLVLLTPDIPSIHEQIEATRIRQDTSRVRKLVAAGGELRGLADVERALLPFVPLRADPQFAVQESVLDMLPELLARKGLPEDAVRALIDAFSEQRPLIEALHAGRTKT